MRKCPSAAAAVRRRSGRGIGTHPRRSKASCGYRSNDRRHRTRGLRQTKHEPRVICLSLPSIPFRSLQTRILALFLLLMVFVQLVAFVLINTVGMTAARKTVGDDLIAGARVF